MSIYGVQERTLYSKGVGPAAPHRLVKEGYWRHSDYLKKKDQWYISLSFRPVEDVCSKTLLKETVGDRLVIN